MREIPISAAAPYRVLVGSGLLEKAGGYISETVRPCRVALITDSTVSDLYADTVQKSMEEAGYSVCRFVFPAGESSKTLDTYRQILCFLAEQRLTRTDAVVALGGGVTGDMTGFAAATYLRGIRFVQIPTTFLAAVDASVGGKTAVDLPAGKNLVGAFWPPALVLCDCDTFATLPPVTFADGVAETIKHGLIADPDFFRYLQSCDIRKDIEKVVCRNVEIKRDFVQADEREAGRRRMLNFGHTVGHAIEACSDYTWSHGQAVAAGMVCASRAAEKLGFGGAVTADVIRILERYGLPVSCDFPPAALCEKALGDKKRTGDTVHVIYLTEIGRSASFALPVGEMERYIRLGMEN